MRQMKLFVLRAARAMGLFALARAMTSGGVRILCYHGIWLGDSGYEGDSMFMSRRSFEGRLAMISELGYPVVSLSSLVDALNGTAAFPASSVVITIDDGWYSTFEAMVPALQRYGMPATLYCDTAHLLGGKPIAHMIARHIWRGAADHLRAGAAVREAFNAANDLSRTMDERMVATCHLAELLGADIGRLLSSRAFEYMTPQELRSTLASGVDLQLHSHNHTLGDMSHPAIQSELEANREALARVLGIAAEHFNHFCYPSGVATAGAADILRKLGVASGTTTEPGLTFPASPQHLLPRFLDGEQVSALEFEAELSGFMYLLRSLAAALPFAPHRTS